MKSLTIHNMDTELYEAILFSSERNRRSMNQEIKDVLYKQFLKKHKEEDDFKKFLGVWNTKDVSDFEERTSDMRKTMKGDWD